MNKMSEYLFEKLRKIVKDTPNYLRSAKSKIEILKLIDKYRKEEQIFDEMYYFILTNDTTNINHINENYTIAATIEFMLFCNIFKMILRERDTEEAKEFYRCYFAYDDDHNYNNDEYLET